MSDPTILDLTCNLSQNIYILLFKVKVKKIKCNKSQIKHILFLKPKKKDPGEKVIETVI